MIEFKTGDILAGRGRRARQHRQLRRHHGAWRRTAVQEGLPDNFKAYEKACNHEGVQPGRMFVYETGQLTGPRFIINFPTKRHWRGESRIEDIEAGLAALATELKARGIRSMAIPPLGSGLGGLNWPDVRAAIERALAPLSNVSVTVFEPNGSSGRKPCSETRRSLT